MESLPAFLMYKKLQPKPEVKSQKRKSEKNTKKVQNIKKIKIQTAAVNIAPEQKKKKKKKVTKQQEETNVLVDEPQTPVIHKKIKRAAKIVPKMTNGHASSEETISAPILPNESKGDNPITDAIQTFKWMINPLPLESFLQSYWEQKPLHIQRSNEKYYSHILNSASLDKIIRNNNLHYTRNIDVVSYVNGTKEVLNEEGRATPSALWEYYSNGCSLRVLNPHTYNQKIQLLLVTLQEYFGAMVGANVYLTPPGSQGFAPHFDDIEAFILQLEGKKHWKLYQPKKSDVLARFSSANLEHKDIGEPFMELTLNAGDILYFPRGTIHEGSTPPDSHSLHITVSVYQQTSYSDLLQNILPLALKKASEDNVEFRRGLPLDYLKHFGISTKGDKSFRTTVLHKLRNLMHDLVNHLDVDLGADLLGKKFIYDSMPPVLTKSEMERSAKTGGIYLSDGQIKNKIELSENTKIRLLRYYCIRVINDDSVLKLYYNTENGTVYHGEDEQFLELEETMLPLIQKLQNSYPTYIKISELPMKDAELKIQLLSSLWEHGLIVSETQLKNE